MQETNLTKEITNLILEKKGQDILVMDLKGLTSITDYFIICTGDSDIQVKAIASHIQDELLYQSIRPWHIEGLQQRNWVLMDYIDVVVHIFQKETREFYALEKLWGDAQITNIRDEDETTGIHKKKH